MGAALDWAASWTVEKKWKCALSYLGPGTDRLMALHPDTAKLVLQKGAYTPPGRHTRIISRFLDPKDDITYGSLMPWLGECNEGGCSPT